MLRRNTIQKDLILNAVNQLHNHPTAGDIYEFIHKDHPNIGKGTVYRNLGTCNKKNRDTEWFRSL